MISLTPNPNDTLIQKMKKNQNLLIEQNKRFRTFIDLSIKLQKALVSSMERSIMGLVWWVPNKGQVQEEIDKQKQLINEFEKQVKQGVTG